MVTPRLLVAVVDDESQVLHAIRRLLELADYHVALFVSGEAFLDSLGVSRPSCAVLDMHMTGISGLDVEAQIRARKDEMPIIFITADDDLQLHEQIKGLGRNRLLKKPFSSDELLSAVGAAVAGLFGSIGAERQLGHD